MNIHELLYADDTLLIDDSSDTLQKFMEAVKRAGQEYGLALNWKKTRSITSEL